MKYLREVFLPEKLEEIASGAFANCEHLETATMPNSLKYIGAGAFKGCGIKKLMLPDKLQNIESEAFMNCNELTDLSIPEKETSPSCDVEYFRYKMYYKKAIKQSL